MNLSNNLKEFTSLTELTIHLHDQSKTIYELELVDDCPSLVSVDILFTAYSSTTAYTITNEIDLDSVIPHTNIKYFKGDGQIFGDDNAKVP
jgi:hypothetical protein